MDTGMLEMLSCGTYTVKGAPGYHQAMRNQEVMGVQHQTIPVHNQVLFVSEL